MNHKPSPFQVNLVQRLKTCVQDAWAALLAGAFLVAVLVMLSSGVLPRHEWVLWAFVALILLFYGSVLHASATKVVPSAIAFNEVLSAVYFVLVAFVMIFLFGYAWSVFGHFGHPDCPSPCLLDPSRPVLRLDALFYSAMIFTTLGTDEFRPVDPTGKLLVSIEALLGVSHTVLFIAFLVARLLRASGERP